MVNILLIISKRDLLLFYFDPAQHISCRNGTPPYRFLQASHDIDKVKDASYNDEKSAM